MKVKEAIEILLKEPQENELLVSRIDSGLAEEVESIGFGGQTINDPGSIEGATIIWLEENQ